MTTKLLQITDIDANTFFGKIDDLQQSISEIVKNAPEKKDEYFNREKTAKFFSVSITTIHHWTKKGLIKSYKLANKVYYLRSELEHALTEIKP